MHGTDTTVRRLGPLSEDCLRAILLATADGEAIPRSDAVAAIVEANRVHQDRFWAGEPTDVDGEIDEVLRDLVDRGYLYEVEGKLRVTDRDVFE